jgi:hypothetical protein
VIWSQKREGTININNRVFVVIAIPLLLHKNHRTNWCSVITVTIIIVIVIVIVIAMKLCCSIQALILAMVLCLFI